nr:cytochrome d ubiquinol oxidase subunit II [Calditrichia bacterium]
AGFSLAGRFLEHPLSLIGVGLATVGLGLFLALLRKKRWHLLRIVAGGLASLIVLSWIAAQYPVAIRLADGEHLTLHATRAPDLVMTILGYGLIFGVLSIFPALFFLIKTFKYRS